MKVSNWIKKIESAAKKLKTKHGDKAVESENYYYNDGDKKVQFPIYFSSIQVMKGALYANPPQPEIRTRIKGDTQSKEISKILEHAISYEIDNQNFHGNSKRAVLDYLLTDLGVCRIRFNTETTEQTDDDGQPLIDELTGLPMEAVATQSVTLDHWPWKQFIYDIGKDWEECQWTAYKHYMTPKELKEQYDFDINTSVLKDTGESKGKATVYEVWDKENRMVYDIISGNPKPLRTRDDPLRLKDFFDCPKPMISNMRSAKYIPQSDFVQIESQLKELDKIEKRIALLVDSIRDAGFYDKEFTELKELQNPEDGKLVPIDGLMSLTNDGSNLDKVIVKLPIQRQAEVVQVLTQHRDTQKEQLYEITGLSDIIRGSSKASETATAQQIKGQWANVRLQDKQTTINQTWREVMRMFAEIISEHFTVQQLSLMTGQEIPPEIKETMSRDLSRCYAIDVETDSTIAADESQDKQDRMDMVNTMMSILANLAPQVQQGMIQADIAKEIALTTVRGFKHGRSLEDMIQSMDGTEEQMNALNQQLQQMQQQAEQTQLQAQQQLEQAGQQIQQLTAQLQQVNEREEARKDTETQGEAMKDQAQAGKESAQADKLRAETMQINQTIGMNQVPVNYGY